MIGERGVEQLQTDAKQDVPPGEARQGAVRNEGDAVRTGREGPTGKAMTFFSTSHLRDDNDGARWCRSARAQPTKRTHGRNGRHAGHWRQCRGTSHWS